MASDDRRRAQHERQRVQRRSALEELAEREARRLQANAELHRQLTRSTRRHTVAYAMAALAVVIAVGHFFAHLGSFHIISAGWDDLAFGWPMAFVIAIAAVRIYGD